MHCSPLTRHLSRSSSPLLLSTSRSYLEASRNWRRPSYVKFHTTHKMASDKNTRSTDRYSHLPLSTSGPIDCAVNGTVLLNTPYFNRGSAHTTEERNEFNLSGLLPPSVQTLEQQATRAYQQYSTRKDDLAKNTFLTSLKEQNLVLYYKVRVNR